MGADPVTPLPEAIKGAGPEEASVVKVHPHPSTSPHIVTLLLSLTTLGVLVVVGVCLLFRRKRRTTKKRVVDGRPITLRRPTAVRNPSSHSHYLKKSPSPTGTKSPPGAKNEFYSPTGSSSPAGDVTRKVSPGCLSAISASSGASPKSVSPVDEKQTKGTEGVKAMDALTYENEKKKAAFDGGDMKARTEDRLGKLFFKLKYNSDTGALVVTVLRCTDLSPTESNHNCDPYVKLQLLPDKQHKAKTRVLRNTLSPVYEEDFTFYGISPSHLKELTLHFVVLSFDRYSRDEIIGEVVSPLAQIDLKEPITLSRQINPRSLKGRGELLLSLCYQPAATRLTVVVLKARNLPKMDITGLSDPYVKIYLLVNGQRITKKKTHVKKRTVNPVFNESFVFDLPAGTEDLSNISLECLLLDWDRVTKNEVIGRLSLGGPNCVGSAKHHWDEVISSPRRQIAEWHKLREANK